MMDLNSVRIFLAVVEKASFTAAAKQLGLPKGTVSYKISELEDQLGVRLLKRTTRAVTTTPEGNEFAERCGASLQHIVEASEWIAQASKAPNGLLRIKAPTIYIQWVIAPALPPFLKAYPQSKVVVSISDDSRTEGGLYHIINRGNYRAPIFRSDKTKVAFLKCVGEACEKCHSG